MVGGDWRVLHRPLDLILELLSTCSALDAEWGFISASSCIVPPRPLSSRATGLQLPMDHTMLFLSCEDGAAVLGLSAQCTVHKEPFIHKSLPLSRSLQNVTAGAPPRGLTLIPGSHRMRMRVCARGGGRGGVRVWVWAGRRERVCVCVSVCVCGDRICMEGQGHALDLWGGHWSSGPGGSGTPAQSPHTVRARARADLGTQVASCLWLFTTSVRTRANLEEAQGSWGPPHCPFHIASFC